MQLLRDSESSASSGHSFNGGQPALVVARWNSWVRLFYPGTGEMTWVDLREVGFEVLETAVEPR